MVENLTLYYIFGTKNLPWLKPVLVPKVGREWV